MTVREPDVEELKRITHSIRTNHGYDFSNYAESSFKRRVARILSTRKLSIDSLVDKISLQPLFINEFLEELVVSVTEMFRDPGFWKLLRDVVLPDLARSKKRIRIWHAGCSSGEEVFSMLILLNESGLLDRSELLATDLDGTALKQAKFGVYQQQSMEINRRNFSEVNGKGGLEAYYRGNKDVVRFNPLLTRAVSYRRHDLVTEEVNGVFDLILCRNVMIYFNPILQDLVLKKFHRNLPKGGYLALGSKESLMCCEVGGRFKTIDEDHKLFRKQRD